MLIQVPCNIKDSIQKIDLINVFRLLRFISKSFEINLIINLLKVFGKLQIQNSIVKVYFNPCINQVMNIYLI